MSVMVKPMYQGQECPVRLDRMEEVPTYNFLDSKMALNLRFILNQPDKSAYKFMSVLTDFFSIHGTEHLSDLLLALATVVYEAEHHGEVALQHNFPEQYFADLSALISKKGDEALMKLMSPELLKIKNEQG